MRTASTTWSEAEWRAARAMAQRVRPPEDGEELIALGQALEWLREAAEERRRRRRETLRRNGL